jgi:hypothetical protein
MKRGLFNLAVVVSVVLCMLTVLCWIRSHSVVDDVGRSGTRYSWFVLSDRGRIWVEVWGPGRISYSSTRVGEWHWESESQFERDGSRRRRRAIPWFQPRSWELGGFAFTIELATKYTYTDSRRAFGVPYWFVTADWTIVPALWIWFRLRRRRTHREGLCPVCGYDLRATPDRCPECGTSVKPAERL